MSLIDIVKIYEDDQLVGYGGNQDWFKDEWPKKAGCASVLGSNLYAYYHNIHKCSKEEFIKIMDDLYEYMTPGRMGFPYFYKFAHQFIKRMKEESIDLKPVYLKKSKSYEQSISFVKNSIDKSYPVGMLILSHQAKELEDDNWHWMCISGYEEVEDDYMIVFSDCGICKKVSAKVLFECDIRNIVKLLRFENI